MPITVVGRACFLATIERSGIAVLVDLCPTLRPLQANELQHGCLMEERVLKGDLAHESSMPRLAGDEERFVLPAMHQTLVARDLCLRQANAKRNLLVFRKRPSGCMG